MTEEMENQGNQPAADAAAGVAPTATVAANRSKYFDEEDDFELDEAQSMSMEDLEALYDETMSNFKEGEVVRGSIVDIGDDRVLVDIGYKSEGIVSAQEFENLGEIAVGDTFDFYIEEPEDEDGMPVLSKQKADRIKNWEHIQNIYEADGAIEGTITRRVKGGLKVDIGIDAFMPASQLTFRPTGDLERYIGERMEFKIIKLTKRRRNVVVSRRKLLEEQRAEEKETLLRTIDVGQRLTGEVKNITDFGAFVDVGGIDGLLHVTDMSWGRVKHPSQVVNVGDKIEVMVLSFDPQSERISLGLKQKTDNPWKTAAERYPVGSIVTGRVVSMTDYGAFVQIEDGIEGMVHVSEMSWTRRVRHPSELLKIDDEIPVMILSVDPDAEKIALGLKQTQPNPWKEIGQRYPVGSTVKGSVRNLTDYGAFVQLEEGIDGLLHVSDMSWTKKVNHPSEVLEKGQEVEVKVLSIDPDNEKISVGYKQLQDDPWLAVVEGLPIGSHAEVEVAKLVSFGAFARLENGIEGLIHVSELSDDRVQKPEEVVSVGDKLHAKVISIDPVERKIGLSVREYLRDQSRQLQEDYGKTGGGEEGEKVDVAAQVRSMGVPETVYQAGRTMADVAGELMAAAAPRKVEEAAPEAAPAPVEEAVPEAPAEAAPAPVEEAVPEAPAEAVPAPAEEAAPETPAEAEAQPVQEEAPAEETPPAPAEGASSEGVVETPDEAASEEEEKQGE